MSTQLPPPRPFLRRLAWLALPLLSLGAPSALAYQDPLPVKKAIEDYLKVQTQNLPGQVSLSITPPNPRNNLKPCATFSVSMAPGARLWGRTSVLVNCQAEGGWKIYVPVHISVFADYLVTVHALTQGQQLTPADLTHNSGDLTKLPDGILTDANEAIGLTLTRSIQAGRPLYGSMLRAPTAVQQGQSVKVVSKGPGFQVSGGDGRALNNASDGQVAQVRMANGHLVSGIARAGGIVEVNY